MADGALDAARRRGEFLCDLRIEHLCHGVDGVHVVDRENDRFAQILIALNVRRDADLVDDIGDDALKRDIVRLRFRRGCRRAPAAGDGKRLPARLCALAQPLHQLRGVARLGHEIRRAEIGALGNDMRVHKPGENEHRRRRFLFGELAQHAHSVEPWLYQLQQHNVRMQRFDLCERVRSVGGCTRCFHVCFVRKQVLHQQLKILVRVGDQHSDFGFHNFASIIMNYKQFADIFLRLATLLD